jgi:uncharacterized membrane protein YgcG
MRFFVLCAFLFAAATTFAQKDVLTSARPSQPVKIDGNAQEWKKPLPYFDEKSKIQYAVANDDKMMYVCFQCPDQMNQIKIMRAGMMVKFSTKGKNKLAASVNFPLEQFNDPAPSAASGDANKRPDPKMMHDRFLAGSNMMTTDGFAFRNGMISIRDSSGLNAAMNWDTANVLVYELAIPLKELFGKGFTSADMIKEMTMNVEIHAIERPSQQRSGGDGDTGFSGGGGGRGRMGGGGGGRMGGGGHRGGGYGGGQGRFDRSTLFEKTEFKHKLVLTAAKP